MVQCPICQTEISRGNFDVTTDVARCPACDITYTFSELLEEKKFREQPPPPDRCAGVTLRHEDGCEVLHIRHPYGVAAILLIMALMWGFGGGSTLLQSYGRNGIQSMVHAWPLLLIVLGFTVYMLLSFLGHTEVRITRREWILFTGIRHWGYRRIFSPAEITGIEVTATGMKTKHGQEYCAVYIVTAGGHRKKVYQSLNEAKLNFIAEQLRYQWMRYKYSGL